VRQLLKAKYHIRHLVIHVDPVLPFELGPHAPELRRWLVRKGSKGERDYLGLITIRRLDVVHNIDVDIVQDNASLGHVGAFPENGAEDDTGFRRRHLDQMSLIIRPAEQLDQL
jgi:hypothetical protein